MDDYHAIATDFLTVIPTKAGIQRVGDAVRAAPPLPYISDFDARER